MSERSERTALYRYYDKADVLLYIGVSNRPEVRAKAHLYENRRDDWPKRAVRRVDEWFETRPQALAAEEAAIKSEKPLYNGKHAYDDATFAPDSWPKVPVGRKVPFIANLMRAEIISGRWAPGQRIPSLRVIGAAVGASQRIVSQASSLLQGEGLLDFQPGHGLFVATRRAPLPKLPHDWPRRFGLPG